MDKHEQGRRQDLGGEDFQEEGGGAPDPLKTFAAHAKDTLAAGRTHLAVCADQAVGRFRRLVIRGVLFLFAASLAFVLACLGSFYLVIGSVEGVQVLTGSRWSACAIVGALCLFFATSLIVGPLWHFKRRRMKALRDKYASSTRTRS